MTRFGISGPFYYVLLYIQLVLICPFLYKLFEYADTKKTAWNWEFFFMLLVLVVSGLTTNYTNILNAVSDLYTTNIPKELVTELAKKTLDGAKWTIEQQSVTGRDSRGYVHLSNVLDYVMVPNTDSVNQASLKIKMVEAGK